MGGFFVGGLGLVCFFFRMAMGGVCYKGVVL